MLTTCFAYYYLAQIRGKMFKELMKHNLPNLPISLPLTTSNNMVIHTLSKIHYFDLIFAII